LLKEAWPTQRGRGQLERGRGHPKRRVTGQKVGMVCIGSVLWPFWGRGWPKRGGHGGADLKWAGHVGGVSLIHLGLKKFTWWYSVVLGVTRWYSVVLGVTRWYSVVLGGF
jgi:hypothetical protein